MGAARVSARGLFRWTLLTLLLVATPATPTTAQVAAGASVPRSTAGGSGGFVPPDLPLGMCAPDWETAFGKAPGLGNPSYQMGWALCAKVWDDGLGDGPVLFVGGNFTSAGGVPAMNIARWNGTTWSALGSGIQGWPRAMTTWNDGTGTKLYVGGNFTAAGGVSVDHLAKWDTVSWSDVGGGVQGSEVKTLAVWTNPGLGSLVVGGDFDKVGDTLLTDNVAQWTGTNWNAIGDGFDDNVEVLMMFGPLLHVGGRFQNSGATPIRRLARYSGGGWQEVGGGVDGTVECMALHFDGTQVELILGGSFATVGASALSSPRVASWSGTSWTAMGTSSGGGSVRGLVSWDDGGGAAVYLTGNNVSTGGGVLQIARWDGASWNVVGGDLWSTGEWLLVHDDGSGSSLWVGGTYPHAGGVAVGSVARWDGSEYHATAAGLTYGWVEDVCTSTVGGGSPGLYVGGYFWGPGTGETRNIAGWKSGAFVDLGDADGTIYAVAEFNDGTGNALYAGGEFTTIDGVAAPWIARWDGASWSPLGSDLDGRVRELFVWNDGSGSALYVGGDFDTAGGLPAPGIARWDGAAWTALDVGLPGSVFALEHYNDGGGDALYAAGTFGAFYGAAHEKVAKWNGTTWESLGTGLDSLGVAYDMEVFDDGGGPKLYLGGNFDAAGGVVGTENLAAWDGAGWSAVAGVSILVESLEVYDDGTGKALYIGGAFNQVDGVPAAHVARFDGATWTALGAGTASGVKSMCLFDDGGGAGPYLALGGSFTHVADLAPDSGASHVALYGGCWDGVNNWTDLGFADPGTFGDPFFVGTGSLALGSYNLIDLSNAFPSALAGLFISFTSTPVPFAGGTLVANPSLSPIFVTTSPLGTVPLPFLMPEGVPPGFQFFFQWAIQDGGSTAGIALSNAIRGDAP